MPLVAFVSPLLLGLAAVAPAWPAARLKGDAALIVALAPGIGIGLAACLFFFWSVAAGPAVPGFSLVELTVCGAVAALLLISRRGDAVGPPPPTGSLASAAAEPERRVAFFRVALTLAAACGVAVFALASLARPHGDWDAVAIWNMRARFLARGGDDWTAAFSPLCAGHPDYPLLLPAFVARSWLLLGHETHIVPVLVAGLFTFGSVGVLAASVAALRGASQGLLAGCVLAGTPLFIRQGASQLADVPLAFFYLATVVLLHRGDRRPGAWRRMSALAGLSAGLAAWTKNEGVLFVAVVLAVQAARALGPRGSAERRRELAALLLGGAVPLAAVVWFKARLAPPGDLFAGQTPHALVEKLLDASRYERIARALADQGLGFGNAALSLPVILALYLLAVGVRDRAARGGSGELRAVLATLGAVAAGYGLVYVLTPYDLAWHLGTSLPRLLLQLWPSLLFAFFVAVRTPEEAAARARPATP